MSEHIISLKSTPSAPQPTPPKRKRHSRKLVVIVLGLVAMAAVFGGCFTLYSYFSGLPSSADSTGNTEEVVLRASKLIVLPDETPTLAVVSDLEKLKGQAFFANAKLGDVVLMFAKAQKAVLYSPTRNKIIEVAPITNTQ